MAQLTNQLAARDASLAEKSDTINELSVDLKTFENTISTLQKELDDTKTENASQLAISK